MRSRHSRSFGLLATFGLVFGLLAGAAGTAPPVAAAETKNLVVLGTSDIHGQVDNYDYFTDAAPSASSARGLTKVATYVNNAKAANPNTILIDDGDTIQGTPLTYKYEVLDTSLGNPMAKTMNAMGYVAATVGNHEFNFGPGVFTAYEQQATFPVLSANVTGCAGYNFEPYVIKDVDGVQVGILGLTPPAVPHWERPENIIGCVFGDPIAAANHYVPEMKDAGADVIVVAAHTGLDESYGYGTEEDFAPSLANQVPGIDVILAGHAHKTENTTINGVLITEPYYQARSVSNIAITVSGSGDAWSVTSKSSKVDNVNTLAEDPTVKAITQPFHDGAVAYINTPIGTADGDFPGGFGARIADGPTADLINQVQTDAAAAAGFPVQASLAALFNNNAKLSSGPIKLKDAYALYIYDNTLYVIDATGQQIKNELEWTANYFNQYFYTPDGVTVNSSKMPDYNYDLWSGIDYKIDVTKPVGQRVVELTLNGQPLAMDQHVVVALNNYRATGQFNAGKEGGATVLYQSTTEVRQLMTDWIMAKGTIKPSDVYVHNYDLLPPSATWLSTSATQSVTRADYANLLWTGFAGSTDNYMKLPGESKPGATLSREGGLYLLGNRAINGNWDVLPNPALLKSYTDAGTLSNWARVATEYALTASIYTPAGNQLLPKQTLTNAEALALVREATYPVFTFLSTNDFHGQLQSKPLSSSNPTPVGGAAYDMAYINNYKALNPAGTTLLDGGDEMQGTPISNLVKGESVIDVFNHMGYKAAVVGNHEFDWGLGTLQDRMAQATYPILAANIFLTGTDTRPSWAKPTAMLTVKGFKVGVIGVTSKDTPSIVMAGNTAGLDFRPVGPIVTQLVAELRAQGADMVIALAHMPDVYGGKVTQEIVDVAQPGVDLIVSGHSHSGYTGLINGIPITQAYSSGTALGISNLSLNRWQGGVVSASLKYITTYDADVTPDPVITSLVQHYADVIGPTVTAVVATLDFGPITRTQSAAGESAMGDLVADAHRWKGGTQIGFTNPGGLRQDITYASYPHDVTWSDVFAVQPFDNKLVTMTLTGSQIYAVLEQQFVTNRMLPISGFKYTYNKTLPAGSRILSVTLLEGSPDGTPILKDSTTFTATMNEYIGTGGDGFSAFTGGTNFTRIGISDLDALLDYIKHVWGTPGQPGATPINPNVYPKIDGRISQQ